MFAARSSSQTSLRTHSERHALGPGRVAPLIRWASRCRRRFWEIGVGLTLYEAFNFAYDWLFYPLALAYWGLVKGGVIALALSIAINALVFWLYDRMRVDWLGAHALRQLEDKANKSRLERLATWLGRTKVSAWEKLASPVVFVALALPIDPVIIAIHHQRRHFSGLRWGDWGLLLAATAAANGWWLIKVGAVVEMVKVLWVRLA